MNRLLFVFSLFFLFLPLLSQENKQQKKLLPAGKSNIFLSPSDLVKSQTEQKLEKAGFVEIKKSNPSIMVDIKYASNNNFTGSILYEDLNRGYLHPAAMEKLSNAQNILQKEFKNYTLLVYDAARPLSAQKKMYDTVKNTAYRAYVADPSRKSLHNYGLAVDITICDKNGAPLDMGTEFDHFGKKAGINEEEALVSQGLLSRQQVDNRKLLRKIMIEAGFSAIRGEWWHFNAYSLNEADKISSLIY